MENLQENLNSDSEDDLPSCGFKWSPNLHKVQSSIQDERVKLNFNEIIAQRKKDEAFFAQMDKLDDLLNDKVELNDNPDNFNPVKSEDKDFKFILERAKEMSVDEPTVNDEPCYVIMKPELSLIIFNAETLQLKYFTKFWKSETLPQVACTTFDNMFRLVSSTDMHLWCDQDEEGLFSFVFYVMSVHPCGIMTNECLSFLRRNTLFYPCLTDFINVFQNWGCSLHNMYVTVPNIYRGLPSSLKVIKPTKNGKVNNHNVVCIFSYLDYVVKIHAPGTFSDIIEPLLRLYFDSKNFDFPIRAAIRTIVLLLIECIPNRVLVKDIHIKDLSLIRQTELCITIFAGSTLALPLGYAILQSSLGCLKIIYCQFVDLRTVYTLLAEKKNIIETSTYLVIYCYLQIIKMFLCYNERIDDKVRTQQINHDNWHNLLHSWSLHISRRGLSANAMVVREDIAKLQYQLRMKQAVQTRQQRDISLHKRMLGDSL